ncbi:MAG: hypothetical protein P1U42_09405 [Phycisphaerales bacterium]|nr:hypothetical protein [Phycisphaerales bacterium]
MHTQTSARSQSILSRMPIYSLLISATLFVGGVAHAQVGPNPNEIPLLPVQAEVDLDQTPSDSKSIRPAIDELLLGKARAEVPDQSNQLNQTNNDLSESEIRRNRSLGRSESIPLGSPTPRSTLIGSNEPDPDASALDQGWVQTIVALSGVLLLILGLGQVFKKLAKSQNGLAGKLGAGGSAPSGIIEVLGRYPISRGMTLVVLKFDRKVLLLSHASSSRGKWGKASSMQTLCELNDAEDIASVLLKARTASGDSIAQSFEQTLREADDLTDEYLNDVDYSSPEVASVRFPTRRKDPVRTITTEEGDRAELWSSGQDSQAAAGVLRRRLATMRREQSE